MADIKTLLSTAGGKKVWKCPFFPVQLQNITDVLCVTTTTVDIKLDSKHENSNKTFLTSFDTYLYCIKQHAVLLGSAPFIHTYRCTVVYISSTLCLTSWFPFCTNELLSGCTRSVILPHRSYIIMAYVGPCLSVLLQSAHSKCKLTVIIFSSPGVCHFSSVCAYEWGNRLKSWWWRM